MSSGIRQVLIAAGIGSGMAAALLAAPTAAGQPEPAEPGPAGGSLQSNCLPSVHGQIVYCDEDVNADGSWVRCSQPKAQPITVFGGASGYVPPGPADCQLVKPNALPAGSPPYHIGYGGEATGRV